MSTTSGSAVPRAAVAMPCAADAAATPRASGSMHPVLSSSTRAIAAPRVPEIKN